jgi:hypothetical protein
MNSFGSALLVALFVAVFLIAVMAALFTGATLTFLGALLL